MVTVSVFTTTFVFILLVYILVHYMKKLRFYRAAAQFPGPPAYPFVGNALSLIGFNEDIVNRWSKILDIYPSPFRFWLGDKLHYVVYEPEQLKKILLSSKALEKHELRKFALPWLGEGLLTAPASKWRIHRKLINPTFNQKILESFVEVFSTQSEIMVKQMEIEVDKGEFDIFHYISLCSLDFICETAMGISLKAQTQRSSPFVENSRRLPNIVATRLTKIWLYPDIIFFRTKLGKEQISRIKSVYKFINDVIQKKKRMLELTMDHEESSDQSEGQRKTFLDLLMELSHEGTIFTDKELREEVNTMMMVGYDTSATILSFATLMVASYPEVQEKLYKELVDIYGSEDSTRRPVRYDDLPKMKYLELVIKETLRIFPVGPVLFKCITDDLNIGKYTLIKGSSLMIPILKTHRSEEYWRNPLEFIPERFLPEECAKRHPYSFIPFSAGPRNCIGGKYAMMSMKVLLATVVRKYVLKKDKIQPIRDIKLKADISLKPMEPIKIKIERRVIM